MKTVWVQVDPWHKELVTAALEAGADAVVLPEGHSAQAKALGRITTVAPDGDIVLGTDVVRLTIEDKEDEVRAATELRDKTLILRTTDWTIIPIENLLAQRDRLLVEVRSAAEAHTAIQILEKGVDGIVLVTDDPSEIRRTVDTVHGTTEPVA
ncbi:3-dehydroquinate synthase II, partial [bacterium]|nr:3-dehydroquinate synthase II [bacterium]